MRLLSWSTVALLCAVAMTACSSTATTGGSGSLTVDVGMDLYNETFDGTITHLQLFWDGRMVDDRSFSPGVFLAASGAEVSAGPGTHHAVLKVVGQTVSSATYTVGESASARNNDGSSQYIDPEPFSATVATGGSITFTVVLH